MFNGKLKQEIAELKQEISELKKKKEKKDFIFTKKTLTAKDKIKAWNNTFQRTFDNIEITNPKGKKIAMDSLTNTGMKQCFNINAGLDDVFYTYYAKQGFIGYQACAMLMNNWFISRACTLPIEEAIAAGYELLLEDDSKESLDDKIKEEQVNTLNKAKELAEKKYDIDKLVRTFGINNRAFGVGYALPIIDGIDYEKPFNIDGVKSGSYKGIKIIDPMWVIPEFLQSALLEPTSKRFFEPEYYRLMGSKRIHKTHFVKIIYAPVADILKPTYFFGGVPLTQMMYKAVYAAESVADEIMQLVRSKRLLVIDGDLESFVAREDEMEELLKAFTFARDNNSVVFKSPDGEVSSLDISLNDLPEVMVREYQRASAIAGITYERMMSTNPTGSNASGEYTSRNYAQLLNDIRTSQLKPLYLKHYQLSLKSDFGKSFNFNLQFYPIDSPTAVETAQNTAIKVNTLATCVQTGALSPDNMRDAVKTFADLGISNISNDVPLVDNPAENPFASVKTGGSVSNPTKETMPVDPKTAETEKIKVRNKGALPYNEKA